MRRRKLAWLRKMDTNCPGRVESAEGGTGAPHLRYRPFQVEVWQRDDFSGGRQD